MPLFRKVALLVVGLAFGCSSCAVEPRLLDASELTRLLLTPAETGVAGLEEKTALEAEGMPAQLSMSIPHLDLRDPCADAVHAGLDTRLHPHASSSVGYASGDADLELGLFATTDRIDVAGIYGDIVASCTGPIRDPSYDVTYTFHPLESSYPGMRVEVVDGAGRAYEAIILHAEVGDYWVMAGIHGLPEDRATQIFHAQVAKLEAALAGG